MWTNIVIIVDPEDYNFVELWEPVEQVIPATNVCLENRRQSKLKHPQLSSL